MITWLRQHPRRIFRVDMAGALLSMFLLGVLAWQNEWVGMPRRVLLLLATGALCLAVYGCRQVIYRVSAWRRPLGILALSNGLYAGVSLAAILYFRHQLTPFGWVYFSGEICIILLLAGLEWKAGKSDGKSFA